MANYKIQEFDTKIKDHCGGITCFCYAVGGQFLKFRMELRFNCFVGRQLTKQELEKEFSLGKYFWKERPLGKLGSIICIKVIITYLEIKC